MKGREGKEEKSEEREKGREREGDGRFLPRLK